VSSSDTERSYVPVADPAERPRKSRATVRVIMIDNDRTLLFEDSDPGVPGTSWWTTPGGGVDDGESEIGAAIREVAEETGYRLGESELLGPIATRHVVHGYSDLVIEQDESFFLAVVSPFQVDISAHTADERLTLLGHRCGRTTICGIPMTGSGPMSSSSSGHSRVSLRPGRSILELRRSPPFSIPTETLILRHR